MKNINIFLIKNLIRKTIPTHYLNFAMKKSKHFYLISLPWPKLVLWFYKIKKNLKKLI